MLASGRSGLGHLDHGTVEVPETPVTPLPGSDRAIGPPGPGAVLYEHMFVELIDGVPVRRNADSPVGHGPADPDDPLGGDGPAGAEGPAPRRPGESLLLLAERTRPVSSSQTRLLPVLPPLAGLLPDGGVRRGSTIVVSGLAAAAHGRGGVGHSGGGDVSLALAVVAAASAAGSWCGLVGLAGLGAVAAHDAGVDLGRLAVVPRPGIAWAEVTAALIDGLDLVVLHPPFPPRRDMARRLVARARDRRSVLVVIPGRSGWPECPDLQLSVTDMTWEGVGAAGAGYLERRRMTVTATGRRSAARPRRRPAVAALRHRGGGRCRPGGGIVNRLLVVRCPDLLEDDEGGTSLRVFIRVIEAVEAYCPWVTTVRPGICSLPARGPARYFGGEDALVRSVAGAASGVTAVEVGVADGLFAALLAARDGLIVPKGGTPDFLRPWPLDILGRPELADLLVRLGIRTLGEFAALPESHVLGRFGADGVLCHRVAGGRADGLGDLRLPSTARRVDAHRAGAGHAPAAGGEPGFWGGASDADARAARALAAVQDMIGADGVVTARLQGARGPAQRARFVTWNAREGRDREDPGAPWPGQIPPPAPAVVHPDPLTAELADAGGRPVSVSGRGLLTAVPSRLSVERGPWSSVTSWAGPWPSDERWWSRSRRRSARLQAVTGVAAHLLVVERGQWRVEATYG